MTISPSDVILWVLAHEKFVLNQIPGDKGGLTFAGIAYNFHSDAMVWAQILPTLEKHEGDISAFNEALDVNAELRLTLGRMVREFYRLYWNDARLDEFWNPALFGVLARYFDAAFHDGPQDAGRWLQRAMNKRGETFSLEPIKEDGIIGPVSQKRLKILQENLGQADYLEIEFRAQWQRTLMIRGSKWSRAFADRIERPLPESGTGAQWVTG